MRTANQRTLRRLGLVLACAGLASCVEARPQRTEVYNENVYLPKDFLTRENPNKKGSGDDAWLYKMTVVAASVPDWTPMYLGDNSQPRYVRFQFATDKVEMIDATEYAPNSGRDKDGNPITSPSLARTVLNAWPGTHVDIQLRDNLDGERTNVIEENRERDWQVRQNFKVDFAKALLPDVNAMAWYLDDSVRECLHPRSVTLVPGSYEIEKDADQEGDKKGDDYFSWTVAVTYEAALIDGMYYCGNKITDAMNRSTFTYHLKYSFWRPPQSTYKPIELAEKDPIRQYLMPFETGWGQMTVYHDPTTDLPGARSYITRFDPQKRHTFYFSETFPERYKAHFRDDIAKQFNDAMQSANAPMRIEFKDWNDGGKNRKYGDIRYSILTFHTVPSTSGLIGMAYLNSDPRTGELYSAGFNMYDWVDHLYAEFLAEYLSEVTPDTFDDANNPVLKTACKAGDLVQIDATKVAEKHKNTSLYAKMESYMNEKAESWVHPRTEEFGQYMRMLLPDLRFAYPGYNTYVSSSAKGWIQRMSAMKETDKKFQQLVSALDRGESPFGTTSVLSPGAIEKGVASIAATKEYVRNHMTLRAHRQLINAHRLAEFSEGWELAPAMARSARMCKNDGKWETRAEWVQRIIDSFFKNLATHEFGHALSLRHNFYGSMDKPHMEENEFTSSIMEYTFTYIEAGQKPAFKQHDLMALKWIYGGVTPKPEDKWLFCTDEHTVLSPFCTTHDIGTTPTEIIKNEIDYYEWMYKFRNFRSYRKFWTTDSYASSVLYALYPLRRFLNLWAVDWGATDLQNDLMLLGVKGDQFFFNNITNEFNDEMGRANRLTANFYKAILQQSAAERSYATKFDNFYGDVTQQGIILDKYFAMFLFVGMWPIDDYDQNIYAYLAYHDYSMGNSLFYSDCQDVVDSMIGGQYDVYPWFKPTAVLLFAQDTHDVMFGDRSKQKWIQMQRYDRTEDMIEVFGLDPRTEALQPDNPYQTFHDQNGATWIYYYMADRNKHVVASKDQNPTAFKIIWDQNESLNVYKSGSLDDYEIKYYLDFYEYFN